MKEKKFIAAVGAAVLAFSAVAADLPSGMAVTANDEPAVTVPVKKYPIGLDYSEILLLSSSEVKKPVFNDETTALADGAQIEISIPDQMKFRNTGKKTVSFTLSLSDFNAETDNFGYAAFGLNLPEGFSVNDVSFNEESFAYRHYYKPYYDLYAAPGTDYCDSLDRAFGIKSKDGYIVLESVYLKYASENEKLITLKLSVPENPASAVNEITVSSVYGKITDIKESDSSDEITPYVSIIGNSAGEKVYSTVKFKYLTGVRGDIDLDGKLTQLDATAILRENLARDMGGSVLSELTDTSAAGEDSLRLAEFLADTDSSENGNGFTQTDATFVLQTLLAADTSGEEVTEELWRSIIGEDYYGKTPLTILCWNENDSRPMVDFFCSKTGVSRDMIEIKNFNTGGTWAPEYYNRYLLDEDHDADIIFVEPDWGLEFLNDDSVTMPLSELGYSDSDFENLYDYIVETGRSTVSGELKAVSWQSAAGGFCYREDLAEQYLGVKNPAEMQEKVKDWDTFLETALSVKQNEGPALSASLGGVWEAYSNSGSIAWLDSDGNIPDKSVFKKYAEFAVRLWDNGFVTKVYQWSDEWKPLGQTDDVMGFFIPAWGFGDVILTGAAGGEEGYSFGKWKVCEGPSPYYWGGIWMAPAAGTDNRDLVKEFIDFYTLSEEAMAEYAYLSGYFMSNKKVNRTIIEKNEYKGAPVLCGQNQFEVLDRVADKIDVKGKISPYDSLIKNEFYNSAYLYCDGTYADSDDAYDAFTHDVYTVYPELCSD